MVSNHLILGAVLLAKSNDALNEQIKSNLTPEQLQELKDFYVERLVDNMSTKDLVAYVTDDLDRYYEDMNDAEFIDEAKNYWEDHYDDVVAEVKEYVDCDFKKSIKDRRDDIFIDINNTGGKY